MLELIWLLINLSIIIYFIIICFKTAKFIREKMGVFALGIFVFVLLSAAGLDKKLSENDQMFNLNKSSDNNKFAGDTFLVQKNLEDNLLSKITFFLKYGENAEGKKLLSAHTSLTGIVGGTNWTTNDIYVDKLENTDTCTYTISGIREWRLIGFKIYSEKKDFKGKIELKASF